ncbi:MAG: TRAP transporter large permease [Spirochaetes bacterium]|nr:TRAP transporter large permease [Spirochaetota bacterium]
MSPLSVFLIMFGLLILLITCRVPVAFSLAFAVIPILILEPRVTPLMMLLRIMRSYESFILLSIPFFLLAANIMNKSGITKRLIGLSKSIVGVLPGGLAHVNIVVSMLFAGLSGSSTADAAGIGSILIPAMIEEKYDRRFTVAVTACSSVMGVIIPPSINMLIWGGVLNVSVAALFLAGMVPGILIGLSQMILVLFFAWKRKYPVEEKIDFKNIVRHTKGSLLALLTPVIIIGGIVGGIVTPTEASLIAVVYSLLLGLAIYLSLSIKDISPLLLKSAKLASLSLFAVGTASIYGWVLAFFKIPGFIVNTIGYVTTSPIGMLFIIVAIFLVVGTFMDTIPAIVILGPLLRPLAEHAGIHPIHFAIAGVMALSFGLITPPYGLCLLIASDIGGINCMDAIKEVGMFLLVMLLVLSLIVIFPGISLFIPKLLMPQIF